MDLTQETFRAAWRSRLSFEGRSTVSTWLHQIAYRLFVDEKRRDRTRERFGHEFGLHAKRRVSPPEHTVLVQIKHDIQEAIRELPKLERAVVSLRYFQGLDVAETAKVTGEPAGTVKWRTRNALERLRLLLHAGD